MNLGTESFMTGNLSIEIVLPESGDVRYHVRNILAGKDYPRLHAPFLPDTIIDIGANIGATAIYFASHYPESRIYCFEPSPSNYKLLRLNTRALTNVKAFDYGFSNIEGDAKLFHGRWQCLQNSVLKTEQVTEEFEAIHLKRPLPVLKPLLGQRNVLKIDTEGCEIEILEELSPIVGAFDIIYAEYHSEIDRLRIDSMLSGSFKLWHSSANTVHRGGLAYLSNRLLSEIPALESLEMKRG